MELEPKLQQHEFNYLQPQKKKSLHKCFCFFYPQLDNIYLRYNRLGLNQSDRLFIL